MKNKRQNAILELIQTHCIDTQEDLQSMLCDRGFPVTQATVSRDIRELNLVKSAGSDGVYRYRIAGNAAPEPGSEQLIPILKRAAKSVAAANNLVVVKTHAGMGNAVGAAVDAMQLTNCLGTLAGDDTLLIIAQSNAAANEIQSLLHRLLQKNEG